MSVDEQVRNISAVAASDTPTCICTHHAANSRACSITKSASLLVTVKAQTDIVVDVMRHLANDPLFTLQIQYVKFALATCTTPTRVELDACARNVCLLPGELLLILYTKGNSDSVVRFVCWVTCTHNACIEKSAEDTPRKYLEHALHRALDFFCAHQYETADMRAMRLNSLLEEYDICARPEPASFIDFLLITRALGVCRTCRFTRKCASEVCLACIDTWKASYAASPAHVTAERQLAIGCAQTLLLALLGMQNVNNLVPLSHPWIRAWPISQRNTTVSSLKKHFTLSGLCTFQSTGAIMQTLVQTGSDIFFGPPHAQTVDANLLTAWHVAAQSITAGLCGPLTMELLAPWETLAYTHVWRRTYTDVAGTMNTWVRSYHAVERKWGVSLARWIWGTAIDIYNTLSVEQLVGIARFNKKRVVPTDASSHMHQRKFVATSSADQVADVRTIDKAILDFAPPCVQQIRQRIVTSCGVYVANQAVSNQQRMLLALFLSGSEFRTRDILKYWEHLLSNESPSRQRFLRERFLVKETKDTIADIEDTPRTHRKNCYSCKSVQSYKLCAMGDIPDAIATCATDMRRRLQAPTAFHFSSPVEYFNAARKFKSSTPTPTLALQ